MEASILNHLLPPKKWGGAVMQGGMGEEEWARRRGIGWWDVGVELGAGWIWSTVYADHVGTISALQFSIEGSTLKETPLQ
ncbi:hypothetical protein U1Q18_008289 [Sarracenia purpurea var. burkii]